MSDYKTKANTAMVEILKAYASDQEGPWILTYSGGKDSTVTAALILRALLMIPPERRTREIKLLTSQTHLDLVTDPLKQEEIQKMQRFIEQNQLPVEITEVEAEPRKSFMYLVVGKGYPCQRTG